MELMEPEEQPAEKQVWHWIIEVPMGEPADETVSTQSLPPPSKSVSNLHGLQVVKLK